MKRELSLMVLLGLTGCSSPDEEPAVAPMLAPPVPLPECPDADYSTCDIREAPCQRQLSELAACMRNNDSRADVAIEMLTEAEYTTLVLQDYADTTDPPIKHFARALATLGLAPADDVPWEASVEAFVKEVAGVYRSAEKRIVVIDRGMPANTPQMDVILLHEIVHALQDADHDLMHWPDDEPRTFDSSLARSTVVEGEAQFYGYRAAVPLLGLDIAEVDFESALHEQLDLQLTRVFESESLLDRSFLTVPYGMGALQSLRAWQAGGARGMDPLWASPPTNMQQVMAQLFGQNEPQANGIEIAEPQVEGLLPYGDDVLGAWGLHLMLTKELGKDSLGEALAWRGDHLWVYTDANELTYALWQLELESSAAALELAQFFARFPGVLQETSGKRVYASYCVGSSIPSAELTAWGKAWLSSD